MGNLEPVATAARWRALTHSYLKGQLSSSAGVLPTPVTPTSDYPPSDPREFDIQRHVERNLAGLHTLLTVAGYPRSYSLADKLRERHGPKLRLLCEEALKIACLLREAFMSQFLEVVIVPPVGAQIESLNRRADKAGLRIEVQSDVAQRFDGATMEDVLPLPVSKQNDTQERVLCTVELGLATTSENEHGRRTEAEMKSSSEHDSRSFSTSRSSLDAPQAISRTDSLNGESVQRELLRQIMLKPKVLLESFVRYIDHEQ